MPAPPIALFKAVTRPIVVFFKLEAASAMLLLLAAVAALVWANSPSGEVYRELLAWQFTLGLNSHSSAFSLQLLVNDGLMAVFFFLVGMEIKRELVMGELRTFGRATLPAIAALGGMVVPAGIYFALNRGTAGAPGWGIPMATDIAFAIGVLTLLKGRIHHALIVFLTALAIFDDMGGILVIAIFYGHGLDTGWLFASAGLVGVLVACNRLYVRNGVVWALAGVALWYSLHSAGIHPTIAGVLLGLAIPARPKRDMREVLGELRDYAGQLAAKPHDEELESAEILHIEEQLEEMEAPLTRFVHVLHPYVAFGVMPVFALANSGVDLSGVRLEYLLHAVPLGAALGLFLGKQVGIFLFTYVAVKLGLAPIPGNAPKLQLYGVAVVGGIGFTVALFIASLAFPGQPDLLDEAKLGILLGSLASGVAGYLLLRATRRPSPALGVEGALQ
ncbi:MAG: Na+/H+ antiporter NhaA [Myxococcales bacterium]|nr:Na+/H+ antiporter NhaA [Myxococcales bacterium]